MKSIMEEYDFLKGWARIKHKAWCFQHMMRVRLYRGTGIVLRYRWARRIGGINIFEV